VEAFAVSGPDRQALAGGTDPDRRTRALAVRRELHDLACQYGRATASPDCVRAGLVADSQDQLAQAATEALALLAGLDRGSYVTAPGIVMAGPRAGAGRAAVPG